MSLSALLAGVSIVVLVLSLLGAMRRLRLWRRGRAAPVRWLGVLAMPRRYLRDVHEVVVRDRNAATLHVCAAGGFVVAAGLGAAVYLGGTDDAIVELLLLLALVVMLAGAAMAGARRVAPLRRPLSRGRWDRLAGALGAFGVGLGTITVLRLAEGSASLEGLPRPAAYLVLLLCGWGLWELLGGLTWGGPMKHAFAGALHLAFHPRPGRFGRRAGSTALEPLDLEAPKLGVETPADFDWNRLLGFDACVECGRCEAACPAFAAGQPLNPKKLVQDLVVGFTGPGTDAFYAGNPHPGQAIGSARGAPDRAVVPALIRPETLWACTTCRACVHECPMMIEHVDAVVDLRRFLTLERGETAGKAVEVLEALRATDNVGGHSPASRPNWAAGLGVVELTPEPPPPAGPDSVQPGPTDVLLWAGDAAFDLRSQQTLRAVVRLLRAGGVDFGILGAAERDCGDLARRLGDEETFQQLARRNIETLDRYRFRRIVTPDPHAFHCLANEYPALGGHYEVLHHTTFLAGLVASGSLRFAAGPPLRVTYHDPCYLARYNGEVESPRRLLEALGAEVREMERSGLRSRCCGAGGGAAYTDVPGRRRIPEMRVDDARAVGAEVVAVACPNCMAMLEGVVQPRPEVRDLAELLADALA